MSGIQRTYVFYDSYTPGRQPGEPGRFDGPAQTGVFWSDGPGVGRRWVTANGEMVLIRPVNGKYVRDTL